MEKSQNLEFEIKKEDQNYSKEQKAYAAPKLVKLGKLTQIVHSYTGAGGDGYIEPTYTAT